MKKRLSRMLCLLLCAVMLLGILPVTQAAAAPIAAQKSAAVSSDGQPAFEKVEAHREQPRDSREISPAAITEDEFGYLYFETFADLKELASRTYDDYPIATYVGDARTFTISENLTLPGNLVLDFGDDVSVTIPAGVTVIAYSCTFDSLTVNGILECEWIEVYENLTVNGTIRCSSVTLQYTINLVGRDRIIFTDDLAGFQWYCDASTAAELRAILASAAEDPESSYEITLWEDITMTSACTVPANAWVFVFSPLTISNTCTVNGKMYICEPFNVKGSLINNGELSVSVRSLLDDEGALIIASTGSYSGSGLLDVYIETDGSNLTLSDVITGVNLDHFDIITSDNGYAVIYELYYVGNLPRLDTPTNVHIDVYGYIHWTNGANVENRIQLNIYCNGERVYSVEKWASQPNTSYISYEFIDGDWQSGTYYFELRAIAESGEYRNSEVVKSAAWTYTRPTKKLGTCTNVKLNGTTLSWTPGTNAEYVRGYMIMVKGYESKTALDPMTEFTAIFRNSNATSQDISWFMQGEDDGWYTFAVQSLSSNINKALHSDVSATTARIYIGQSLPVPEKPYKIVNVVSGVHVYWNAVDGAAKYGVWRSETGKDGTYKWIANPTVPHFTDTTAVSGKTYYYRISAVDSTGTHTDKSEAVGISFVSTPDISGRTNTASGIKLDWKKITGATGYAIYRKSYAGTDAWVRVGTISGGNTLTWTDTSVKNNNGVAYKYTIRAIYGNTLSGCRNAGRTMVRLSSQVLSSAAKASSTSVKCAWTTSSRVTGYEVRFVVNGSVYKTFTIGNYKTGVKTFTGLKAGQTYTVQVRTYKKVDGVGSFYSDWSTAKTVKT